MKIIFLDIDGVLNTFGDFSEQKGSSWVWNKKLVENLNRIVKETGAAIVVSSVWRILRKEYSYYIEEMGIKATFVGMTPYRRGLSDRGDEIQCWMDEWKGTIEKFIIIDDDSDMCHLMDNLVQTKYEQGLTKEIADEAIRRLNADTIRS